MPMSEERQLSLDKKVNQFAAILLPLVEAAGLGYATYVVIYLICIQYLMHPPTKFHLEPRNSTAIGLIVAYCILLLVFGITFLRLLQVIWVNPGVVALGDASSEKHTASTKYFDRLDAYECDYQGWPQWCDKCHNWKPDRTHHSSQLGRCVRRMDHYCPYAGGIISETSHKFFVQFLFYGFLYTGFVLVVMAIFFAERNKEFRSTPATWIVAIGLSAIFFLFTFGMFMTTFYNLAINYTTVEIMQKGGIHNIALLKGKSSPTPSTASSNQSNILCEIQRTSSRSYIVVQTQPDENPWDLGVWKNIRSVMGENVLDWFVPWKMSPIVRHSEHEGEFAWGRVVHRYMAEYQAGSAWGGSRRSSRSRRRCSSRVEHPHV